MKGAAEKMSSEQHCGYVAIVGRPNVGKSTLLNHLLRQKISITSRKPQTTRHRILGISSDADTQIIYVDTPGLHSKFVKALNRVMNETVHRVVNDVDVILFVVERLTWNDTDQLVLDLLSKISVPVLLLINKIDLAPYVGASLEVMKKDAARMRGDGPFAFTNLKSGEGLEAVLDFVRREGMIGALPGEPDGMEGKSASSS